MDVATLQLTVENGRAVLSIKQAGEALDQLGVKGDEVAVKLERTGNAAKRAASGHDDLAGATVKSTRAMTAMNALEAEASKRMGEHSLQVGRVERSMEALAARMLGVNDTLALSATALAKFGLGEITSLGILAGIVAVGAAWKVLGDQAGELGTKIDDAMKKLRDGSMEAQLALGDLQIGKAKEDVTAAKLSLKTAEEGGPDASRSMAGSGGAAPIGSVSIVAVERARAALAEANQELFLAQQQKSGLDYQMHGEASKDDAEALALRITTGHATTAELHRALAEYKSYVTEINSLGKSQTDNVRRDADIKNAGVLKAALFPKGAAARDQASDVATAISNIELGKTGSLSSAFELDFQLSSKTGGNKQVVEARAKQLVELRKATSEEVSRLIGPEQITKTPKELHEMFGEFKPPTEEQMKKGVLSDIKAAPDDFQNLIDRAKILETLLDTVNAKRSAKGESVLKPDKQLTDVKAQALDMGLSMMHAILGTKEPLDDQIKQLAEVKRLLEEIGDTAPKDAVVPQWKTVAGDVASGARSAADAINLFGSTPRAQQEGNILNTGANAIDDVSSGHFAAAALAVASLGKQLFSLGSQSHETKDRINEANEALKSTMSIESDILNHNPLQALLDQAKQSYDQLYASINATLPGLKNQTQRNIDLAAATSMYGQQQVLVQKQFALQTSDFSLSMQARADAAKGLGYDAAKLNLQIQQQNEMANIKNTYGDDSIQAQTLATVQNSEMLKLVNDSLTQITNAPSGFFAEKYFSGFASMPGMPSSTPQYPTTSTGATSSAPSISGNTFHISVPGAGDPAAVARAVVSEIRRVSMSTSGTGSLADAMELMA